MSSAALDLGFAVLDVDRERRQGLAEVVYSQGKTVPQIVAITQALLERQAGPVLVSRIEPDVAARVTRSVRGWTHHPDARLLVWRAGWLKNQGLRNTRETSLAKWHATDHAVQSALDAIQVHGANGYSNEFPVERYLRNSKAAVIYEGTSQLHTLIQADYALGYREDRPLRCEPWPAQGWERPSA